MIKEVLDRIKEVLERNLNTEIYLAIFLAIPPSIYFLYQNGLLFSQIGLSGIILIIMAILVIYTLLWRVLDLQKQQKKRKTVADKIRDVLQKCENPNLKIETIKQTTYIEGPNVRFKREYSGRNYSNEKVPYFVAPIGGDKPLTLNEVSCEAKDGQKHLKVEPFLRKDRRASNIKILKIIFEKLLEPKERFRISMEYRWPCTIDPKGDYIMFTVSPYKFVDNAEFNVSFDGIPNTCHFYPTDTTCGEINPESIDIEDGKLKLRYFLECIGTENYKFTFGP